MPKLNRINWTYVGNRAGKSRIELKHFLESGNMAVFCNGKILITDFDVFDTKEYSFFIGEEFCKITINKHKNGMFGYDFKIVEDVDTPLNRLRKKILKKDLQKSSLLLGSVFLFVFGIFFGGYFLNRYYKAKDLRENGIVKTVKMTVRPHVHHDRFVNVTYKYWYRNRNYLNHIKLPMNGQGEYMTTNGFPLETGDEFLFVFSSKKPSNNRIDYQSPPPAQIYKYRCRTIDQLNKKRATSSETAHDCLLDEVYRAKGISGWAHLYYQHTARRVNTGHNERTYERMMQDGDLKKALGDCVD